MALSKTQQEAILTLAEQLHEISQAAKQGRTFVDLSTNTKTSFPGRSIEHIVTELTFLSTILFAKGATLNAHPPGSGTIGSKRGDYFGGSASAKGVVSAFAMAPDKTFPYKGVDKKCSINFDILDNTVASPSARKLSEGLHNMDFMQNAANSEAYAPGSCVEALKLLRQFAEVLDRDR